MTFASSVHAKAIDLTRSAIEMTTEAGSGHPSSAASLAHITTVLLYHEMRYDPMQPDHPGADRLVLSEGHACPIIYAAGADLGFAIGPPGERWAMEKGDALRLREAGSPVDGHPNPVEGFPFFPAATGSLGQGLSMGAGLAMAARADGHDRRVFCIIGDGESREGQVWEALDLLVDQGLSKVCPIFNCNGFGQTGEVSPQQSAERLAEKVAAFGLPVDIVDGHDPEALRKALGEHALRSRSRTREAPLAIIAQTVKGWGSERMQGDLHGKPLPEDEVGKALADLDGLRRKLDASETPGDLRGREDRLPLPIPAEDVRPSAKVLEYPAYEQGLEQLDRADLLDKEELATRKAHGAALQMLGRLHPHVFVLDGDVSNSTYSEYFAEDDDLRERFVQCRIGEQNMMSCAVGLSAAGKVPFVSTFGKFLVRAYDQLEMAIVSDSNVKLVGSHVGVSPAADGPSQMALADVAFFRALGSARGGGRRPLMYVSTPSDARSAYDLTMAMAEHEGACYLRTLRPNVPHLYGPDHQFNLGGHEVLVEGEHLAIFAWGYMVHEAKKAVERLQEHDIRATLVDAYSLPFDGEQMVDIARRSGGLALVVEDNYGAALGGAVAEAVARAGAPIKVDQMFVERVPKSARTPDEILDLLGLSADHIVRRARQLARLA